MDSTRDLLKRLNDRKVEYVVVGGLAGVLHGSGVVTEDVDVCAPLTRENLSNILAALRDVNPKWRMNPDHPALPDDPASLADVKNLYLVTDVGQIDFLSEITGVGEFREVASHTVVVDLDGVPCDVLDLDALIAAKRALGRPKDLQVAIELEALRERTRDQNNNR